MNMEELKPILNQRLSPKATAKKALNKFSPFFLSSFLTAFFVFPLIFFYTPALPYVLGGGFLSYFFFHYRISSHWKKTIATLPPEDQEYVEKHFENLSKSLWEQKRAFRVVKKYQDNRPKFCEKHYGFYSPELEELLHKKIISGHEVFFLRSLKRKSKERQEINSLMKNS